MPDPNILDLYQQEQCLLWSNYGQFLNQWFDRILTVQWMVGQYSLQSLKTSTTIAFIVTGQPDGRSGPTDIYLPCCALQVNAYMLGELIAATTVRMKKLFISYRRDDTEGVAGRIYDRLAPAFGNKSLFFDVETIPPGVDFRTYLNNSVGQCDILLALIGRNWLSVSKNGMRRLDDSEDFVRIEIESALQRQIPVVPVLIGRVVMPNEGELPKGMQRLAFRNAVHIDPGRGFHGGMDELIKCLKKSFASASFSLRDAKQLLSTAPQETIDLYSELFLSCKIHDMPGWLPDLDSVLAEVKRVFRDPQIISATDSADIIRQAEHQLRTFSTPKTGDDEWENEFDRVRVTLQPIINTLPARSECVDRILQIPKDILAASLVNEFCETKDPKARCLTLEFVEKAELGRQASLILEGFVDRGWSKSIHVQQAVRIAQRAFGDSFDDWYKRIRGESLEEERVRAEKQEREEELQRERYMKEDHEKRLEEFRPKNDVVPQALTANQVPLIYQKIKAAIRDLRAMQSNEDHRGEDIHAIAHATKHLLRRFYPHAAYRIHEIEITYTEQYATSMLIAELESMAQQLEIDFSAELPSMTGASTGWLRRLMFWKR